MNTRWVVALVAGLLLSTRLGPAAAQEMTVLQSHAGNNFRPGLRIAADAVYLGGGTVSIDGVSSDDAETECRYGLTLSVRYAADFRPNFPAQAGSLRATVATTTPLAFHRSTIGSIPKGWAGVTTVHFTTAPGPPPDGRSSLQP